MSQTSPLDSSKEKTDKALAPYLSNLEIRDDVDSCTIAPSGIEFRDPHWNEINDEIKKLNGSWVKATKFTRGYWRIVKDKGKS